METGQSSKPYEFKYARGNVTMPCELNFEFQNYRAKVTAIFRLDQMKIRGITPTGLEDQTCSFTTSNRNRERIKNSAKRCAYNLGWDMLQELRSDGKVRF